MKSGMARPSDSLSSHQPSALASGAFDIALPTDSNHPQIPPASLRESTAIHIRPEASADGYCFDIGNDLTVPGFAVTGCCCPCDRLFTRSLT